VLVTSTPGIGHLQSVMPLARALRDAGHEVLWATAPQSCDEVSERGFAVAPAGMNVADRQAAFAPRMPEVMALAPRDRRALLFSGFFAQAAAPAMRGDLAPIIDEFRPDLIVHETAELAAAPMAIARGLPHISVAFSGALPDSAIPLLIDSLSDLWSVEGAGVPTWERIVGDLYLHPFAPAMGSAPQFDVVRPTRPEPVQRTTDAPPPWLASFGRDRPGIYLTAGTEAPSTQAPWNEAFAALGSLPVDVVATIGPFVDPTTFDAVPPNVHVERFVHHGAVLERASIVASHAGAGTLLASATMGLPQLLCPVFADQWQNADALANAGAGIVCELDARSTPQLTDAIIRLLDDVTLRDGAARLAAEFSAMPTVADHLAEITRLADR
jgi:UDP:flavonoid glycosyltransferase YjiC (YdhE family)